MSAGDNIKDDRWRPGFVSSERGVSLFESGWSGRGLP